MAKKAYNFEVTDTDALAEAYPACVKTKIVPETKKHTVSYKEVSNLLKHGIEVPGVVKKS